MVLLTFTDATTRNAPSMEYQGFPTTEDLLAKQTSEPNVLRALVYGLAAGVVAAGVWYAIVVFTQHEVGLVAVAVGWLVGQGVVLGSGGKRGLKLQLLSVLIALAAMAGAEYFILREALIAYLAEQGGRAVTLPLFLPLDLAFDLVTSAIQDDPLELFFWAIALYGAFRVPMGVSVAGTQPAPAST